MLDTMLHLLALICFITSANAARILGIFPMVAKSHFSCNYAILKSLHTAGHNITMISPFPPEREIENFTHVIPPASDYSFVGQIKIEEWTSMTKGSMVEMASYFGAAYCDNVLKMSVIQDALHSSEKLYDVLLAEYFIEFDCYLAIAEKLNIPTIATVTFLSSKQADMAIGVPNNPAVIPTFIWSSSVEMNLIERMENLWNNFILTFHAKRTRWRINEVYRKYFGEKIPSKKNVSLVFYNNHASLYPRPTVPNAVDVGGIHITTAQPLPKDIQKFIDEAPHGVILFTLGSTFKGSTMPIEKTMAFLSAFASIPQRVIWKYEATIENLPKNIMISSWLPQRDILEHKNVIAFMSHCGLSGVYEAVTTGTPVITIPLFSDQWTNAALLHYRGIGINLDFQTATKESVLAALDTIINDTSYYQRMQEFSYIFKDRPMTPAKSVVYWTEYVIRHNGASYLRAIGTDMPFYKYFMLDIAALVFLVSSTVIYVIFLTVRKICRLVMKELGYVSWIKKND